MSALAETRQQFSLHCTLWDPKACAIQVSFYCQLVVLNELEYFPSTGILIEYVTVSGVHCECLWCSVLGRWGSGGRNFRCAKKIWEVLELLERLFLQ